MGIASIVSDLKGVADFANSVFGKEVKPYPSKLPGGITSEVITNSKIEDKNWKKSLGYAFRVVLVKNEVIQAAAPEGWKEFRLQINPQELTQDEIFAIEVTPTLRGVVVEHQGVTLKDITISGTTGISPGRKEGGATSSGIPVLSSGRSGYKEFHELRSFFRVYVESKRLAPRNRKKGELRLVFRNLKDNENLFVEPQKFTMKRSAAKPFMYDYTIVLKAIGVANGITTQKGFFDTLSDIADTVEHVQETIELGAKVINGSVAIIRRFERDIEDTVLNPLRALNDALIAIKGGEAQLLGEFGIFKRAVQTLREEVHRVKDNFTDIVGKSDPSYNAATGRSPTLVGNPNRTPTYSELQLLNAFKKVDQALSVLISRNELFIQSIHDAHANLIDENVTGSDGTAGSIARTEYTVETPPSTSSVSILGGDTIQTLAARELGDPDRFKELVVLNNLRPPYIDPAGGPGVLKPGQKILLPNGEAASDGAITTREYPISKGKSQSEKNLGVDIRLTDDNDFAVGNTNDLDLIIGVENMIQALALKLFLEKGSLKRHLSIGTNSRIGSKMVDGAIQEFKDDLINSIGSDPRVESIPFIEVSLEGSSLIVQMIVKVKEFAEPVPLTIPLPNAA